MLSIYQIFEERERIGKLPITLDEFKYYAENGWDSSDKKCIKIFNTIKSKYGQKVANTFHGWIEGNQYSVDINTLYEILQNMPVSRLDKMMGAGSNGSAIDMGDKVCKIFHKNTPMSSKDRMFYEYCMENPDTKVFPIIYKLGKNFVIMEKLQTDTPKCALIDKYLGYNGKQIRLGKKLVRIEDLIYEPGKYSVELIVNNKELWYVYQWGKSAIEHLKKSIDWDRFSDLRLANLGERKNGDVVWFDI